MPDLESAQNSGTYNPVKTCFAFRWSQGGHRSKLMPDLESAQNVGSYNPFKNMLCYLLVPASHRTNLMPDLELAQNSGCYNPVKTCFATSWSHVKSHARFGTSAKFWYCEMCYNPIIYVLLNSGHSWPQGGHRSNLMTDSESAQNFGMYHVPQPSSHMFC